ncbi:hypothetical protein BAE44_0012086 [Dichanthelium oligosanthes]|uniref:Uncharacterized protein n=1 Tax=Dichanthelium oligosanthes TaxID=888268 RepID=A0A1E5VP30_9POAL|nr:hypothetical protein BAE44_0012086 [Dichanthelium oligosanthes]
MPELNSPKGPRCIAVSIPWAAAHAMADFEIHPDVDAAMFGDKMRGSHTDSLYMMDMVPGQPCSFEVLAYYPASRWCWRPLTRLEAQQAVCVDLSAVALGSCDKPPAGQHVGLDVALVNLGSGRFCIAKFFDVFDNQDDYESHLVVFTGVEVVPSHGEEGVLSMVNHKSECLVTDDIKWVL